ncbi:MAG: DUF3536 domain-containing protein [Thermomicrobiales bacterium]|nr:DUF3536 domain-containing protein [Thermomicrobiales bacterium]
MSSRYVIIHGHFYQPPREDPLTEEMPWEPGAHPYHDYNEKILAECYRPNADLGNFSRMSFNIGPTLATWMRRHHPSVLRRIANADRLAVRESGFGTAIAQGYHHTILPLDTPRDRQTELRWGVRSFELLYGRKPRGIWLPETSVDHATLRDCADEGLTFTILASGQSRPRGPRSGAYAVSLGGERAFTVLTYDAGLGGTVSFDPAATVHASEFAARHILPNLSQGDGSAAAITIATDGEVYGHHHKFKDLFLQDLLARRLAEYGLTPASAESFVTMHPATVEAELVDFTSWGCGHHLARWSDGCDCTAGSSAWKRPLRDAFDALAARIDHEFEERGSMYLIDPWGARDAYIDVVEGAVSFSEWYEQWRTSHGDEAIARQLLESQRLRLSMYASCAFYWEALDRLEPTYGIRRARAAATLLDNACSTSLASAFQHDLAARLNRPEPQGLDIAAAG